jgi:hypothetical protein
MKNYQLRNGWSNDSDGNTNFTAEFEAKDMDHAVEYVKKNYVNKEVLNKITEDGDGQCIYLQYDYWTTENGEETTEDFDEDKHTFFTEFFEIYQEDEE